MILSWHYLIVPRDGFAQTRSSYGEQYGSELKPIKYMLKLLAIWSRVLKGNFKNMNILSIAILNDCCKLNQKVTCLSPTSGYFIKKSYLAGSKPCSHIHSKRTLFGTPACRLVDCTSRSMSEDFQSRLCEFVYRHFLHTVWVEILPTITSIFTTRVCR